MKRLDARRLHLATALLTLAAGGCNRDSSEVDVLPRVAVSGHVTLDGKPLPQGKIQLQPDASTSGVMVVGEIRDGTFSIDRAKGPVPGKYHVQISSLPVFVIKEDEIPGSLPKPTPEKVPRQYRSKSSRLEAEVKSSGPNSFEFALGKTP
jgi:hypothetical protein